MNLSMGPSTLALAKVQWPPSGVKREGDLTFDPLGEDSDPAWATESKTSVPTFTWCEPLLPSSLERRTNGHGRQNQGKAMANHLCQRAKKAVMSQANKEKKR